MLLNQLYPNITNSLSYGNYIISSPVVCAVKARYHSINGVTYSLITYILLEGQNCRYDWWLGYMSLIIIDDIYIYTCIYIYIIYIYISYIYIYISYIYIYHIYAIVIPIFSSVSMGFSPGCFKLHNLCPMSPGAFDRLRAVECWQSTGGSPVKRRIYEGNLGPWWSNYNVLFFGGILKSSNSTKDFGDFWGFLILKKRYIFWGNLKITSGKHRKSMKRDPAFLMGKSSKFLSWLPQSWEKAPSSRKAGFLATALWLRYSIYWWNITSQATFFLDEQNAWCFHLVPWTINPVNMFAWAALIL